MPFTFAYAGNIFAYCKEYMSQFNFANMFSCSHPCEKGFEGIRARMTKEAVKSDCHRLQISTTVNEYLISNLSW